MNKSSDTFCIMPHINLSVQNDGDVCACNLNKQSYKINGEPAYLKDHNLDEFWNSNTRFNLMRNLDTGIKDESCNACWTKEAQGKTSSRQYFNSLFEHIEDTPRNPKVLIIKPGNTCNGACIMCDPATSSMWYRDGYELALKRKPDLAFSEFTDKFETVRASFDPKSDKVWPDIARYYENLEFIDIYGGEPFLIKGLWTSLEYAVNKGYAKDIALRLHTNTSIYDQRKLDILKQFKHVELSFSFDSDLKEEFEYIRYPLKWDVCYENALRMIDNLANTCVDITVTQTVVIPNVHRIDESNKNLEKMLGVPVILNFVYDPEHLDIRHLPSEIKQQLIRKTENNLVKKTLQDTIPGCVMWWPKFCLETDKLDMLRNNLFAEAFPKWASELQTYWEYNSPHPEWFYG